MDQPKMVKFRPLTVQMDAEEREMGFKKVHADIQQEKTVESLILGNKSVSPVRQINDDSAINHCEDYSQNLIDKTDMQTLIYDTSVLSKNASDFGNKSAINPNKFDSDEENPYDESKSDLFNPMTQTRG